MTAIKAGRLLSIDTYNKAVAAIADGESQETIDDHVRAANYAVKVSKEAAVFAWEAAGSSAACNPSKLQRCFGDMCVGAGHQVFDQRNFC